MGKRKAPVGRRAWNLLRLALLWARKGGVFKRGLMMNLQLLPNYLKSLCHNPASDSIHYREREFSFDETPIIDFKMHRPASMRFLIPCLNAPSVDFDFNDDVFYKKSFLPSRNERGGEEEEEEEEEEEDFYNCQSEDEERTSSSVISYQEEPLEDEDEEGDIDLRAEEFIAKFYEQMKLQRQNSYLRYHEMLNRGTS